MPDADIVYEVLVASDERWTIDSRHAAKTVAMSRAKGLLGGNQHDAVKVTREIGDRRVEVIFQQECTPRVDKPLTISPIDEAAVCEELVELTGFPARKTAGRVLRKYLDEYLLTALEVLFNHDHLRELRRTENLSDQAIHKVASVQSRALGVPAQERIDRLYRLATELTDWTRDLRDSDRFLSIVRNDGLTAALRAIGTSYSEEMRPFYICAVLAGYVGQARDWREKLKLVFDLLSKRPDEEAVACLDEICAEIMDGSNAVMEVLGPQPDLASALRILVQLSAGRLQARRDTDPLLARFSTVMSRDTMPETRAVLLERVARETGATKPLTREDEDSDRARFPDLVGDLISHAGLLGGPAMSEAVTRRARIVMGDADGDLSADEGIEFILARLPTTATKMGYLLDLSRSAFGLKYQPQVLGRLLKIVTPIDSLTELLPPESSREALAMAVEDLRLRVGDDALGAEIRTLIEKKLDGFLDEKDEAEPAEPAEAPPVQPAAPSPEKVAPRSSRTFEDGEVVFCESEAGDEAFVIVSGTVEISVGSGKDKAVVATLGRGEVFGEMALIDDEPRMATATAVGETAVYVVPQDVFKKRLSWLAEEDRLISHIIETLVSRLREQMADP